MRIDKIKIKNFRGFKECEFRLAPHVTLFIGANGTGKTAILDALAVGAGSFLLGIDGARSRPIEADEVRRESHAASGATSIETQFPAIVACDGVVGGEQVSWSRTLAGVGKRTARDRAIANIAEQLLKVLRAGKPSVLPLICYYGTGRLWLQKRERSLATVKPTSRTAGYADCLDPASDEKSLLRWFKTMEIGALQKRVPITLLDGVKAAVSRCMENWRRVYFDVPNDELMAEDDKGHFLPSRLLSDGQRTMLAMVMDIAYRAAVLNPHLGAEAPAKTPGVVLIDEIDLHLHPRWQKHVLDDLRRTFPNVQFIATTHSPFIVQSLRPGELIDLDGPPEGEYVDKSIEDIAENVMGVPQPYRSQRMQEMMQAAKEYYQVLERA